MGGLGGFARGRVVRRARRRVSGIWAAFWAESRQSGPTLAARSSRCLGWGGQGSFIPGRGTPSSAPSEPPPESQPEAQVHLLAHGPAPPPLHFTDWEN